MPRLDLQFQLTDLAVELSKVSEQTAEELAACARQPFSASSRIAGIWRSRYRIPLGITTPNSLNSPRI
jgi:hypothetical protein